jgi:hypothetical protein
MFAAVRDRLGSPRDQGIAFQRPVLAGCFHLFPVLRQKDHCSTQHQKRVDVGKIETDTHTHTHARTHARIQHQRNSSSQIRFEISSFRVYCFEILDGGVTSQRAAENQCASLCIRLIRSSSSWQSRALKFQ